MLSNEWTFLFRTTFCVVINGIVVIPGVVSNIINMIVFIQMGFKDSINISLLGLTVADLTGLVFIIWDSICTNPLFYSSDIPFQAREFRYITSAVPHGICVRVAWCITTYITFERCLCVAVPLKVKYLITPKRTFFVLVSISLVTIAGLVPILSSYHIEPTYLLGQNRTYYIRVYNDYGELTDSIGFAFSIACQFGSLSVLIVCTAVTTRLLLTQSKWRHETSFAYGSKDGLSLRDKKVVKMVLLISSMYIVCIVPSCLSFICGIFSPDYSLTGKDHNIYAVVWSMIFTVETVHSSINIFVYYKMSTKFKTVFLQLLFLRK